MTTPEIQNALLLVAKCVRITTGNSRCVLEAVRRAKTESGRELKASLAEIERSASRVILDILNEIECERQKIDVLDSQHGNTGREAENGIATTEI